ncbi:MAG: aspartate/glutamate racemase family protein [Minisyncoccia bacterium]|jgi:glutamate racemase
MPTKDTRNKRMIGFFDSGSGGLSVLSVFRALAPEADTVYFGDIANAPYGEKTQTKLETLTKAGIEKLQEFGATQIVAACNSVASSVLAGAAGTMPVIEMTAPTGKYMAQYAGKKFLLIATPATVASGIYDRALASIVTLDSLAIPGLAGAIEFGAPEAEIRALVRSALSTKKGTAYDGMILACTHYPLVFPTLAQKAKEILNIALIVDPAVAVATEVAKRFDIHGQGAMQFLISKESDIFRRRVAELFPNVYTIISV